MSSYENVPVAEEGKVPNQLAKRTDVRPSKNMSFIALFKCASGVDIICMFFGSIGAIVSCCKLLMKFLSV